MKNIKTGSVVEWLLMALTLSLQLYFTGVLVWSESRVSCRNWWCGESHNCFCIIFLLWSQPQLLINVRINFNIFFIKKCNSTPKSGRKSVCSPWPLLCVMPNLCLCCIIPLKQSYGHSKVEKVCYTVVLALGQITQRCKSDFWRR